MRYYVSHKGKRGDQNGFCVVDENGRVVLRGLTAEAARAYVEAQSAIEKNWKNFLKLGVNAGDKEV